MYKELTIKNKIMELLLILKILLIVGAIIAAYAVLRNLDIIKIILIYVKDTLLRK
jgi:hypothetical protein